MLKLILEKYIRVVWVELIWLRIETCRGLLRIRWRTLGFCQTWGNFCITEPLLASQEGLRYMELDLCGPVCIPFVVKFCEFQHLSVTQTVVFRAVEQQWTEGCICALSQYLPIATEEV
jgi:hypothetical protein